MAHRPAPAPTPEQPPAHAGASGDRDGVPMWTLEGVEGRGLHSSTFQLNLSALYGTGGARRGCVARVWGV
jgi:hypothetical protein